MTNSHNSGQKNEMPSEIKQSKYPKVSVYIASHNYGRFLEQAIESVLRQHYLNWELLVIDDGSTDETDEIMRLYASHPKIKTYKTQNIGLPSVANFALSQAMGEYIIRLDGDDIFDENILLVLASYLDANKDCALVFSDYYLVDEGGEVLSHERRHKLSEINHVNDMPPNGACTLVRVEILKSLGGYREDLGAQDGFDLWAKIRNTHDVFNVNLPLFHYRRHGNNLTNKSSHIFAARRTIKRDATENILQTCRPILCVIPCRKNYDFRTDLWASKLGGRSLLHRKIEICLSSNLFNKVIVASDDHDVLDVLGQFSDSRLEFFLRDSSETIRSRSVVNTLKKVSEKYDPTASGITVLSYISSPFASKDSIEESIYTLIFNDADCSLGVVEAKEPIYCRTQFGLKAINQLNTFRTDYDYVYKEANVALATKNINFRSGSLMGPVVVNFLVPAEESFYIDSELKFKIATVIDSNE
jgi:glycosyltransferase involved in cell wall biosynthesis